MKPSLASLSSLSSLSQRNPACAMRYSHVSGRAGAWFFVDQGRALKADSCLLEPGCGDLVLLAEAADAHPAYILAVLAQADTAHAALQLPGQVTLRSEAGCFSIEAQRTRLTATETLTLTAPQLDVSALTGQLDLEHGEISARRLQARFGQVQSVAQSVCVTVGRLVQKARDSFRWTERLDESRCANLRINASERVQLDARQADMYASVAFKIDSQKIDLG